MTGDEVRKLKTQELKQELSRIRMELFDLRSKSVTEKVDDLSSFGKKRRDVARLLTERRARHLQKLAAEGKTSSEIKK